jgi:cytochrome b6-f complex iron-sulfur subunit
MDEKKPSTADIMAKIRAQKAAAASAAAPESPVPEVAAAPAADPPAAADLSAASKPAAPAAKPGSTKDILAAIRAKGATPAASTAPAPAVSAAAAPAEAAAAKPVAAAATAGPRPSVQDMLKAVREGKAGAAGTATVPVAAAGAKPVVSAPPAPVKPQAGGAKKGPAPARRGMAGLVTVAFISLACFVIGGMTGSILFMLAGTLVWMVLVSPFVSAWASLVGVSGVWTLATARFMFPNVLVEPPSKFKVGPMSDYPLNTVSNKWKDQFGIWVVHTDQYEGQNLIFALASVCTHLGCTPSWLDGEQKFKCPCHGSGFYITGVNFEGPAPRPLERMGLRIAEGMLEVDKSVKFQEEMGQWKDPASFVAVS